jgi:hypothetical protein
MSKDLCINVTEQLWDNYHEYAKCCNMQNGKALDWLDRQGVSVYKTEKGNYFLWQDRQVSYPCGISNVPRYVTKALYSLLGVKSDEHFTVLTDTKLTKVICDGKEEMFTAKGVINHRHEIDKIIGTVTDFEEIVKHTDTVSEACRDFYDMVLVNERNKKSKTAERE